MEIRCRPLAPAVEADVRVAEVVGEDHDDVGRALREGGAGGEGASDEEAASANERHQLISLSQFGT